MRNEERNLIITLHSNPPSSASMKMSASRPSLAEIEQELNFTTLNNPNQPNNPTNPHSLRRMTMEEPEGLSLVSSEPLDMTSSLDMSLISEGVVGRVSESMGKWTRALQHWVQDNPTDLRVNGEMPSYNQLVLSLEDHLHRQHRINQANLKLNSLNYMVGMANFAKNKTLQKHLEEGNLRLIELRTQMKQQYDEIVQLQESIDSLNYEVEDQKLKSEELEKNLQDTESRLTESLELYRREVEQQKKLVEEQQRTMQRLTKTKFNQDFLLDVGFVVASLYIVNMSLVKYPLQLLTSFLASRRQQQSFYQQITKLVLCIFLVKYSRDQAQQLGFHNQVGSWYLYFANLGTNMFTATPAASLKGTEGPGKTEKKGGATPGKEN